LHYKQCVLDRSGTRTVTWLPEEFAKPGKVVKLRKKRQEDWTDGWQVKVVGKKRLSEEQIACIDRQFLHHRETTDI